MPDEILRLKCERYMPYSTYAGTRSYTVEKQALAPFRDTWRWCLREKSVQLLRERMADLGQSYDNPHLPECEGKGDGGEKNDQKGLAS